MADISVGDWVLFDLVILKQNMGSFQSTTTFLRDEQSLYLCVSVTLASEDDLVKGDTLCISIEHTNKVKNGGNMKRRALIGSKMVRQTIVDVVT